MLTYESLLWLFCTQQTVPYKEYNKQNKANKLINYCLLRLSLFEMKKIKHLLFIIGLLGSEDIFSNVEISNVSNLFHQLF